MLSKPQRNILEALAEQTTITRGPNAGRVKARLDAYATYDGRSVAALERRGLISFHFDSIYGPGHAVTPAGRQALKQEPTP